MNSRIIRNCEDRISEEVVMIHAKALSYIFPNIPWESTKYVRHDNWFPSRDVESVSPVCNTSP
jgi:hypothetical protein